MHKPGPELGVKEVGHKASNVKNEKSSIGKLSMKWVAKVTKGKSSKCYEKERLKRESGKSN